MELVELAQRYVELVKEKREAESNLKNITGELDAYAAPLISAMQTEDVPKLTTGGMTIYIRRELWARASAGQMEAACDALVAAGLGEYVHPAFNASTLSSYVRELVGEQDPADVDLPAPFREGLITVSEFFKLGAVKGSAKAND